MTNGEPSVPRTPISSWWAHPTWLWLVLLGLIFTTEFAVTLVLSWLLPREFPWLVQEVFDAVLLTIVVAPALWWTVVRPLQHLLRMRTRFLADLFATIETE